ncbi:thiol reductant ABC exporter subunit CydC [uncultured Pseudomonas sp.]|uniref:thiol reductant ABC exporter subunit CydC n=1 Tax=uncultured Pseudomonas sp. TaxID=114707 RepID=UPI0025CD2C8B|nr:thiol reductant ABC exporter subunit CydC [uncultured Pseudomonas sp.]
MSGKRLASLRPILALFWAERRTLLLVGAMLAALTVLCGMALLGLSGWFISATAIAGLSAATALAFDVFMPSSGIRLFTLGRTFARYGERLATHDATLAVLAALRVRLFRGWAQPRAARQLALRPARLLFRLTCDIDALDSLYLRVLVPLGAALAAVLAASVALGAVDLRLGLVVLALMVVTTLLVLRSTWLGSLRPAQRRAQALESLRAQAADLVAGQTELLMAGRLAAQGRYLAASDARLAHCDDQLNRLDNRAGLAFGVLGSVLLALTLLVAGWLVSVAAIDVPVAVFAVLLALTVTEPLAALRRGALEMGRTTLAARRIAPQLSAAEPTRCEGSQPAGPVVQVRRACARHPGAGRDALQDIDLHIEAGERVALVGCSGAGKSSLLALLSGELALRSGEVRVTSAQGWLTQRTELFQDSLRDNLLLAAPAASDAQLWQALDAAGLGDPLRAWPEGLDTRLGEGGQGLSGGQARRLALARLLLQNAPLWLLDEPSEGLDGATARQVLAGLDRAGQGRAWLLVTHLRREAALADRLLVLEGGRVCAAWPRGSQGFDTVLAGLRPD